MQILIQCRRHIKHSQQTVSQHVYRNQNFSDEQLDHKCTVRIALEINHHLSYTAQNRKRFTNTLFHITLHCKLPYQYVKDELDECLKLEPLLVKYLTDSFTGNNASVQLLFFLKSYCNESIVRKLSYKRNKIDSNSLDITGEIVIPRYIFTSVALPCLFLRIFRKIPLQKSLATIQ